MEWAFLGIIIVLGFNIIFYSYYKEQEKIKRYKQIIEHHKSMCEYCKTNDVVRQRVYTKYNKETLVYTVCFHNHSIIAIEWYDINIKKDDE